MCLRPQGADFCGRIEVSFSNCLMLGIPVAILRLEKTCFASISPA